MNIYFVCWVIIQYEFTYFVAEIIPALAIKSSFRWLLYFFDIFPTLFYFECCLFAFSTYFLALQGFGAS